ncbi:hypothetical protein GGF41_000107 [Coemansia sp. RSA 2531]|nr:hypothetical protein GGF41_000107 [Coemansia sp. RSA 2531]
MSSHFSLAQAPPIDILHAILDRVVNKKRLPFNEFGYQLDPLKELLTVSSTWRQVALKYLWRRLRLTIDDQPDAMYTLHPSWFKANKLPLYAANLVTELHLEVPMSCIVSGVAHKYLAEYMGDIKCFPFSKKIIVTIITDDIVFSGAKSNVINNALELANMLMSVSLTPATARIKYIHKRTQMDNESREYDALNEEILGLLFKILYGNTKHAMLHLSYSNIQNPSTFDHLPLLSSLELRDESSPDMCASLVRRFASTLQCLRVSISNANMLIYDVDDKAVMYPNLQYLGLSDCIRNTTDMNASSLNASNAIPFPVLRSANLYSLYPFANDVLFRGNTKTLEYLNFVIDKYAVTMFNKCKTFESKDKVLRHVLISDDWFNNDTYFGTEAETNKLLNHLVSAAERLSVSAAVVAKVCVTAAQNGQGFQNIKLFEMGSNMSLFDVLCALTVLPALVKVRGGIKGFGSELENISQEELPGYVASTFRDVGENLQVWSMNSFASQYSAQIVDYILLLALASPKFRRIEIMPNTVLNYYARVTEALESGPYSKYASQLTRLLDAAC